MRLVIYPNKEGIMQILYLLILFTLVSCMAPPPMTKEECNKKYIPGIALLVNLPEYNDNGKYAYDRTTGLLVFLRKYKKCLKKAPNNSIIRRKL